MSNRSVRADAVAIGDVIDLEFVSDVDDNAEVVNGSRTHYWLVLAATSYEGPGGPVRLYVAPRMRMDKPTDGMQAVTLRAATRLFRVGTNQHLHVTDLELIGQY